MRISFKVPCTWASLPLPRFLDAKHREHRLPVQFIAVRDASAATREHVSQGISIQHLEKGSHGLIQDRTESAAKCHLARCTVQQLPAAFSVSDQLPNVNLFGRGAQANAAIVSAGALQETRRRQVMDNLDQMTSGCSSGARDLGDRRPLSGLLAKIERGPHGNIGVDLQVHIVASNLQTPILKQFSLPGAGSCLCQEDSLRKP